MYVPPHSSRLKNTIAYLPRRAEDIVTMRTMGGIGVVVAPVHWPSQLGTLAPQERKLARLPEAAVYIILIPRLYLSGRVPDSLERGL